MTSKVRRSPAAAACLAAALLLAWAGCGERNPDPSPGPERVSGRFGAPYEIVLGTSPAAPDMPPALLDDTLRALVTYPGGCKDHDFSLAYDVVSDTSRLWLRHDAHGDDCEARISDEVLLSVPSEAVRTETVILQNPHGGPPFMLRW